MASQSIVSFDQFSASYNDKSDVRKFIECVFGDGDLNDEKLEDVCSDIEIDLDDGTSFEEDILRHDTGISDLTERAVINPKEKQCTDLNNTSPAHVAEESDGEWNKSEKILKNSSSAEIKDNGVGQGLQDRNEKVKFSLKLQRPLLLKAPQASLDEPEPSKLQLFVPPQDKNVSKNVAKEMVDQEKSKNKESPESHRDKANDHQCLKQKESVDMKSDKSQSAKKEYSNSSKDIDKQKRISKSRKRSLSSSSSSSSSSSKSTYRSRYRSPKKRHIQSSYSPYSRRNYSRGTYNSYSQKSYRHQSDYARKNANYSRSAYNSNKSSRAHESRYKKDDRSCSSESERIIAAQFPVHYETKNTKFSSYDKKSRESPANKRRYSASSEKKKSAYKKRNVESDVSREEKSSKKIQQLELSGNSKRSSRSSSKGSVSSSSSRSSRISHSPVAVSKNKNTEHVPDEAKSSSASIKNKENQNIRGDASKQASERDGVVFNNPWDLDPLLINTILTDSDIIINPEIAKELRKVNCSSPKDDSISSDSEYGSEKDEVHHKSKKSDDASLSNSANFKNIQGSLDKAKLSSDENIHEKVSRKQSNMDNHSTSDNEECQANLMLQKNNMESDNLPTKVVDCLSFLASIISSMTSFQEIMCCCNLAHKQAEFLLSIKKYSENPQLRKFTENLKNVAAFDINVTDVDHSGSMPGNINNVSQKASAIELTPKNVDISPVSPGVAAVHSSDDCFQTFINSSEQLMLDPVHYIPDLDEVSPTSDDFNSAYLSPTSMVTPIGSHASCLSNQDFKLPEPTKHVESPRTVEPQIKKILKPAFLNNEITKEEYKEVMRMAVPKVCQSKKRVTQLDVSRLVQKYIKLVKKKRPF